MQNAVARTLNILAEIDAFAIGAKRKRIAEISSSNHHMSAPGQRCTQQGTDGQSRISTQRIEEAEVSRCITTTE